MRLTFTDKCLIPPFASVAFKSQIYESRNGLRNAPGRNICRRIDMQIQIGKWRLKHMTIISRRSDTLRFKSQLCISIYAAPERRRALPPSAAAAHLVASFMRFIESRASSCSGARRRCCSGPPVEIRSKNRSQRRDAKSPISVHSSGRAAALRAFVLSLSRPSLFLPLPLPVPRRFTFPMPLSAGPLWSHLRPHARRADTASESVYVHYALRSGR